MLVPAGMRVLMQLSLRVPLTVVLSLSMCAHVDERAREQARARVGVCAHAHICAALGQRCTRSTEGVGVGVGVWLEDVNPLLESASLNGQCPGEHENGCTPNDAPAPPSACSTLRVQVHRLTSSNNVIGQHCVGVWGRVSLAMLQSATGQWHTRRHGQSKGVTPPPPFVIATPLSKLQWA